MPGRRKMPELHLPQSQSNALSKIPGARPLYFFRRRRSRMQGLYRHPTETCRYALDTQRCERYHSPPLLPSQRKVRGFLGKEAGRYRRMIVTFPPYTPAAVAARPASVSTGARVESASHHALDGLRTVRLPFQRFVNLFQKSVHSAARVLDLVERHSIGARVESPLAQELKAHWRKS